MLKNFIGILFFVPMFLFSQSKNYWYPNNESQLTDFDSAFSNFEIDNFVLYYRNESICSSCEMFQKYFPKQLGDRFFYFNVTYNRIEDIKDSVINSNKFLKPTIQNIIGFNTGEYLLKINKELRLVSIIPFSSNRNYDVIFKLLSDRVVINSQKEINVSKKVIFTSAISANGELFALSTSNNIYSSINNEIIDNQCIFPQPKYKDFIERIPKNYTLNLIKDTSDSLFKEFVKSPIQVVKIFEKDSIYGIVYQITCLESKNDTITELAYYFIQTNHQSLSFFRINSNNSNTLAVPALFTELTNNNHLMVGNLLTSENSKKKFPLLTMYKFNKKNEIQPIKNIKFVSMNLYDTLKFKTTGFFQIFKIIDENIFFEYGGVILTKNHNLIVPEILTFALKNSQYQFCKLKSLVQTATGYSTLYSIGYSMVEIELNSKFEVVNVDFFSLKPYWDPSHIVNNEFFLGNNFETKKGKLLSK